MDILTTIINGIGVINQKIPPGIYQVDVITITTACISYNLMLIYIIDLKAKKETEAVLFQR